MNKRLLIDEDLCVCCGAYVPEGRMICPQCEIAGPAIQSELTPKLTRKGRPGIKCSATSKIRRF